MKFAAVSLFLSIFFLASCERTLDIKLAPGAQKLVVEGTLYEGEYPFVTITNSVGFQDVFDLSKAQFEIGAIIKVKDNTSGDSITLREYVIDTFLNGNAFKFAFHSIDIAQPNHFNFVGKLNHNYTATITNKGKSFIANTSIPGGLRPDSMWTELRPLKPNEDSIYNLRVLWRDPDTLGNYTKYATKVLRKDKAKNLNEEWLTDFGSVFDDAFNNGKTLAFNLELGFTKGVNFSDSISRQKYEMEQSIFKGDTVIIRYSPIDYKVYQYWTTLEYSRNSTGNPFAAPTKVSSNISDAIGVFGGYGVIYDTLIVK